MMSKRALLLGAFGLAALAAGVFWLQEPDPQAVLRQATKNLLAEKTFHADLQASFAGLPVGMSGGNLAASATGIDIALRSDIDRTQPATPASVSTFEFVQHLASGGRALLSGEARRKDGVYYARLQAIEGVEGIDAARVVGRWMKSDRSFLELLFAEAAPAPLFDEASAESMKSAIMNVDLFSVQKKLSKETVAGESSYHYAVALNMEAVSALLLKQRELETGKPIAAEDVLAVTNELVPWGKPAGEIWIGAHSRRLKKMTLTTTFGQDGKGGTGHATLMLSKEGTSLASDAPQAEDVDKVLGPLFDKRLNLAGGRSLAQASPEAPQPHQPLAAPPAIAAQETDTDSDGLSDSQEFFYGTDAWSPDTDGDGYPDGLEVDKGMNPLGPGALFGFGL